MSKFILPTILLLLAIELVTVAECRILRAEFNPRQLIQTRWKHIGRFGFRIGTGNYTFKAKLRHDISDKYHHSHIPLNFVGFIDEDYAKIKAAKTCVEKLDIVRFNHQFELPLDGCDVPAIWGDLVQKARSRVWHFAIADCNRLFPETGVAHNKIDFTIEVHNSDGSHLSEEENGLLIPHLLATGLFLTFFAINVHLVLRHYRKEGELDYPLILLDIACWSEFLGLAMETLYLGSSMAFGDPFFGSDFLSTAFSMAAEFIMTGLLLLMANGWSIIYAKIEDLDLLAPMGILATLLQITFWAIGRIKDDDPLRTHDYDHWTGYVLFCMKVVFFALFISFGVQTYKKVQKKIKQFVLKVIMIGSVYLLAKPVLLTICTIFVDHMWRHKVLTVGHMLLQCTTMLLFASQFNSKGSAYNAVSLKQGIALPNKIN